MPTQGLPIEPSAFRDLQRRIDRLERENARTAGRKLITVDRFTTANLPAPSEGQIAIETVGDTLMYYSNGEWRTVGTGSGGNLVPVNMLNPRVSSMQGMSFFNVTALTAWDAGHMEFVKDVEGKAYGIAKLPSGISNVAVVLEFSTLASSGVSRLQVSTAAIADGESINPASLTAETAQDITSAGAYLRKKVRFPASSGNISPAIAADDLLLVEVFHDGDHANDTLAENTMIFGVWLEVS